MKRQHRIFQKFLLFVLVFWVSLLNAQQYPVQVTPVLLPPYSLRLGDYATTSENKLQLQLLMKDLMEPSHRIKIRFSLESGVNSTTVVQNNPFINGFQEITLYPGTPILLTNIDLRPLFQLENLTGINAVNYARPLPEGMYKFCFQVFDSGTGRALSAKSAAIAYLVQYEPPILNLPQQGEKVLKPGEFQNIVFQWMPRQMAPNTKYIFTLKELWDTQRDPVSGFLSSRIFCQEETYAPTLYYGMDKTALIPGKRYAWQVQAKSGNPVVGNSATEDNGVYKNNGLSEIFYFDYTENCIVPIMLTAKNVGRGKTEIRWSMTGNSPGSLYRIQYRRKGSTAEWAQQESYQDMCILTGLKDETEYEYRVGSVCGNLYQTDNTSVITGSNATDYAYAFSEVQTFITDNKETSNSNIQCGILPQVNISNKSPLQTALGTNEVFIAGDFPVTVLQSQGTSGTYTGYGYIEVPYLADTKIKVTFSNIQLNTDKQLIGGILETTYDVNEGNIIKGSDIVETFADFWDGIKDAVGDLYDGLKNKDKLVGELANEFQKAVSDAAKNKGDSISTDFAKITDYINSPEFEEEFSRYLSDQQQKIENNEMSKELFASLTGSFITEATEKMSKNQILINGVYFIEIAGARIRPCLRSGWDSFTTRAKEMDIKGYIDYTINGQQYEGKLGNWTPIGLFIYNGKRIAGRSSSKMFYASSFQKDTFVGLTFGQGDPSSDSEFAVGGGIPLIINGLRYGIHNIYSDDAPLGLPLTDDPKKEDMKYLIEKSNTGYAMQNHAKMGKSILAYNSRTNRIMIIVQPHGIEGMTLDQLREYLIERGYDNAISFDGSSSATLVKDQRVIVQPALEKDETIPIGLTISEKTEK
ncbi:hypothetical protein FACS1894169_04660 [Bacteroidia bacterium]|nr:hypothetical protein FACS1894169_04660 [Bacteroidia bacterium]